MQKNRHTKYFVSAVTAKTAIKNVCFILGLTISAQVGAAELYLTGRSGIDSNPLSLSNQHDPEADLFLYGDINFSTSFDKKFLLDAYARQTVFINDSRANWFKSKIDFAYKSSFKLDERKFRYKISIDVTYRDKTYVSKTTGEEATDNGESIKDRYDYVSHNYNASISHRNERKTKFELRYQLRDKDYEDFQGLDDFDYDHDRFKLSIDHPVSDSSRVIGGITSTRRDYKDRRADDLDGVEIAGTDRKYDYLKYSLDYYYRRSKAFRFKAALDYQTRDDNAVGYSDSTLKSLVLSIKNSLSDDKTLETSIGYSKYSYDNRNIVDELSLEEEDNERETISINLEFEEILSSVEDHDLTRYFSLRIVDADSSDSRYEYQRYSITVGLRYDIQ